MPVGPEFYDSAQSGHCFMARPNTYDMATTPNIYELHDCINQQPGDKPSANGTMGRWDDWYCQGLTFWKRNQYWEDPNECLRSCRECFHHAADYGAGGMVCYAWKFVSWCKMGWTRADFSLNTLHECHNRPCQVEMQDLMQDLRPRGRKGAHWEEIFYIEDGINQLSHLERQIFEGKYRCDVTIERNVTSKTNDAVCGDEWEFYSGKKWKDQSWLHYLLESKYPPLLFLKRAISKRGRGIIYRQYVRWPAQKLYSRMFDDAHKPCMVTFLGRGWLCDDDGALRGPNDSAKRALRAYEMNIARPLKKLYAKMYGRVVKSKRLKG